MVRGRARVALIGWKWGHELAANLPEVAANLPLQRHFRGNLRVFCAVLPLQRQFRGKLGFWTVIAMMLNDGV